MRIVWGWLKGHNPVPYQLQAAFIDVPRPDVRHVSSSNGRQTVVQHRSIRIARSDDLPLGESEGSLRGKFMDRIHLVVGMLERKLNARRAAALSTVAVGTIDREVRSSAGFEVL